MLRRLYFFISLLLSGFLAAESFREAIVIEPERQIYSLSQAPVIVDSLSGNDSLRWTSDNARGRFILLKPVSEPVTVTLYYHTADQLIPGQYGNNQIRRPSMKSDTKIQSNKSQNDENPAGSNLNAHGTLFRSVQVSSSGSSQMGAGIDLRISGELAPGYTLSGAVADQSVPTQAYSSSQSLQEIDRIYLQLNGPGLQSQMGDISAEYDWSYWTKMNRQYMGFQAAVERSDWNFDMMLGSGKGRYQRTVIAAKEGVQGPYRITANDGSETLIIVPRSERVYINGRRLAASEYTLYLSDAEIEFGPQILISAADRIIVEFNYRNEFYPRTALGDRIIKKWTPGRQVSAGIFQEADNEMQPIDATLLNLPEDSLQNLGRTGVPYLSTAQADSNGNYILTEGIFYYAGSSEGDYSVSFYRENKNGGYVRLYDSEGFPYYKYDPDSEASQYFPRRRIELPEFQRLIFSKLNWDWSNGAKVTLDGAASFYTPNLYQSATHTRGFAGLWGLVFPLLGEDSPVSLSYNGWKRENQFTSFERILNPDYEQELGIAHSDTVSLYQELVLQRDRDGQVQELRISEYTLGDTGLSRYKLSSSGRMGETRGIQWQLYRLAERTWLPYYYAHLQTHFRIALWQLDLNAEQTYIEPIQSTVTPRSYQKYGAQFSNAHFWQFSYQWMQTDSWNDSLFIKNLLNQDLGFRLQTAARRSIQADLNLTWRNSRDHHSTENYLLLNNRVSLNLIQTGITGKWQNNIQRNSESLYIPVFLYVGEGLGQYSWDDVYQEYVPDELGNYILRRELSNEQVETVSHKNSWNFQWSSRRLLKMPVIFIWRNLGQTEFKTPQFLFYQTLSETEADSSITFGKTKFKNEWLLRSNDGKKKLQLSLDNQRTQDLQDLYRQQIYGKNNRELSYHRSSKKLIWSLSAALNDVYRKRLDSSHYQLVSNAVKLNGTAEFALKKGWIYRTEFYCTGSQIDYSEAAYRATETSSHHELEWQRSPKERLMLNGDYAVIRTDFPGSLPYEVAFGRQTGINIQGYFRYERQLGSNMSVNGLVQYRRFADSDPLLIVRMEIRAIF